MTSRTSARFRASLGKLPAEVVAQARSAYRTFAGNPHHPGLQFRQVHPRLPIYSARIGLHYRAVGRIEDGVIVWFWIGTHAAYDALLSAL